MILSFAAANDKHNLTLREWALVTTEIALTLTIVAALFYWSFVRDEMLRTYNWDRRPDRNFMIFMSFLHIAPLVMVALNFLLSDIEFLKRDVAMIALIAVTYIIFNFAVSKLSGLPVYQFLTWYDARSFVSAIVFILLLAGIFMLLVILSAIMPRKTEPYVND